MATPDLREGSLRGVSHQRVSEGFFAEEEEEEEEEEETSPFFAEEEADNHHHGGEREREVLRCTNNTQGRPKVEGKMCVPPLSLSLSFSVGEFLHDIQSAQKEGEDEKNGWSETIFSALRHNLPSSFSLPPRHEIFLEKWPLL